MNFTTDLCSQLLGWKQTKNRINKLYTFPSLFATNNDKSWWAIWLEIEGRSITLSCTVLFIYKQNIYGLSNQLSNSFPSIFILLWLWCRRQIIFLISIILEFLQDVNPLQLCLGLDVTPTETTKFSELLNSTAECAYRGSQVSNIHAQVFLWKLIQTTWIQNADFPLVCGRTHKA